MLANSTGLSVKICLLGFLWKNPWLHVTSITDPYLLHIENLMGLRAICINVGAGIDVLLEHEEINKKKMDSLLVIEIVVNLIISAVKCAILPWTNYAHFNPVFTSAGFSTANTRRFSQVQSGVATRGS